MNCPRHERNALAFENWLSAREIPYTRTGSPSIYIQVDGDIVVRFSDHPQPVGGGFDIESGYQHGESEVSVHPGGATPADARRAVQVMFSASEWRAREQSARLTDTREVEALRAIVAQDRANPVRPAEYRQRDAERLAKLERRVPR